jgi:hypothetical protein
MAELLKDTNAYKLIVQLKKDIDNNLKQDGIYFVYMHENDNNYDNYKYYEYYYPIDDTLSNGKGLSENMTILYSHVIKKQGGRRKHRKKTRKTRK